MYGNLKTFRELLGMTQKEFADSLSIKLTTYNGYETGAREPKSDFLITVAQRYNVTVDYLMGNSNNPHLTSDGRITFVLSNKETEHIKKYRTLDTFGQDTVSAVLECEYKRCQAQEKTEIAEPINADIITLYEPWQSASAGYGKLADDETSEPIRVYRNPTTAKADFIMRVKGKSMEPSFWDGQRILVHAQPFVELGEIGIFIVAGERYVKTYRGSYLESTKTGYPDIKLDESSVCTGKVLGVLQEEWIVK